MAPSFKESNEVLYNSMQKESLPSLPFDVQCKTSNLSMNIIQGGDDDMTAILRFLLLQGQSGVSSAAPFRRYYAAAISAGQGIGFMRHATQFLNASGFGVPHQDKGE